MQSISYWQQDKRKNKDHPASPPHPGNTMQSIPSVAGKADPATGVSVIASEPQLRYAVCHCRFEMLLSSLCKQTKQFLSQQIDAHRVQITASYTDTAEPLYSDHSKNHFWFGHVTRHDSLSKTILGGNLREWANHGQQKECWMNNIKKWTSLPMPEHVTMAFGRKDRKRISAELSVTSPRRPNLGQGTKPNWKITWGKEVLKEGWSLVQGSFINISNRESFQERRS